MESAGARCVLRCASAGAPAACPGVALCEIPQPENHRAQDCIGAAALIMSARPGSTVIASSRFSIRLRNSRHAADGTLLTPGEAAHQHDPAFGFLDARGEL